MSESFNIVRESFKGPFVGRIIEGFPYPAKDCRYCYSQLILEQAVHVQGQEEVYKALFFCHNDDCPAYNEPARKQYAKVYYSCDEAFDRLEMLRIMANQKTR